MNEFDKGEQGAMSAASNAFEQEIVDMVNKHKGEKLPPELPGWLMREGVVPGATIIRAEGIGSLDKRNKTDVVVYLRNSEPIKISAKLRNADYFGNWYGHERFILEFGRPAFDRMTRACTDFANDWAETATAPFVGVSICFGRRPGRTGKDFTDIFTTEDILTVAKGYGTGVPTANCMYIADTSAKNIPELIRSLEVISVASVNAATEGFKVAFRPINPITEGTNRWKNVYTRFEPYRRLASRTVIRDPRALFDLGEFVEVEPNRLNHNRILDELEWKYNIVVPRKQR